MDEYMQGIRDHLALHLAPSVFINRLQNKCSSASSSYNISIMDASSSTSIYTVQQWIEYSTRLPSKYAYIESAVNLACILTKHLCHTMAAASTNVKVEDYVNSENIFILVDHSSLLPLNSTGYSPSATSISIKFRSEISNDAFRPFSMLKNANSDDAANEESCNGAVCAALGKVLLEIFSVGRSRSDFKWSDAATSNGNSGLCDKQYDDETLIPPSDKRQARLPASSTSNSSKSTMANNLLQVVGMPVSICQLIGDLLDAENIPPPKSALTSIKEVLWDLTQMKTKPESFLFDRVCPQKALDDTLLFGNSGDHTLFGREKEIATLMDVKDKVSFHVRSKNGSTNNDSMSNGGVNFLCESAFLGGYAGSGKSSLVHSLVSACKGEQWFVLDCKFDKTSAPHMTLAKAFDSFFGSNSEESCNPLMKQSFNKVCRRVFATVDNDGFDQLCDLIPSFARVFPLLGNQGHHSRTDVSSMDKVGTGQMRLQNLFHVLFRSLCSAGCPVLFSFDDLQWSGSSVMTCLREFAISDQNNTPALPNESDRQGILIVGAYRKNEVSESSYLIRNITLMKESERTNVIVLDIGELTEADITMLISAKLKLPFRYTKELASLVVTKTLGNPFFVTQFLRCVIQNKYLDFSVRKRQWEWDIDVVDMQMISDGVAELLTSTFSDLPSTLMQTMKILSLLGSQVEECTIDAMNSRNQVLSCNMQDEMERAVKYGLMEKAGCSPWTVYQFTHDIVQQTIYDLVPAQSRPLLHKTIGEAILESVVNDPTLHLLGVDQINLFCKDGTPSQEDRGSFAEHNAIAATHALSTYSFDQARSYIDMGLQLLDTQHWANQYSLSLKLFEMSASLSFIHGDSTALATCLDNILMNANTFDDSLKASSLLVKLLASKSKFEEATSNLLEILSSFGVVFPSDISLPVVLNELLSMQSLLRDITYDQMKQLPTMTDRKKLHIMKFLNMLCMYSNISKPMLLPLASSRMVRLMVDHGMCDDAIVGLATVGYSIFLFTEEINLATQVGKVSEALVQDSSQKHILRSRLCNELYATLKTIKEPWQAVVAHFPELYESAMLSGDVENAMICKWSYLSSAGIWVGTMDLLSLSKHLVPCLLEVVKYEQHCMLYSVMTVVNCCASLTNKKITIDVEIKSLDELNKIGEETNNSFLIWQVFMCKINTHFWRGEYAEMANLSEKYSIKHPQSQQKRILQVLRCFYEGIAYFSLARQTKQVKYMALGKTALSEISHNEVVMGTWNFSNKSQLLQAESHYLVGDLESAEAAYKTSCRSSASHNFIHEEALAYELYGIFCIENNMINKGLRQLHTAMSKYEQWGATMKVKYVEDFIKLIQTPANDLWKT